MGAGWGLAGGDFGAEVSAGLGVGLGGGAVAAVGKDKVLALVFATCPVAGDGGCNFAAGGVCHRTRAGAAAGVVTSRVTNSSVTSLRHSMRQRCSRHLCSGYLFNAPAYATAAIASAGSLDSKHPPHKQAWLFDTDIMSRLGNSSIVHYV